MYVPDVRADADITDNFDMFVVKDQDEAARVVQQLYQACTDYYYDHGEADREDIINKAFDGDASEQAKQAASVMQVCEYIADDAGYFGYYDWNAKLLEIQELPQYTTPSEAFQKMRRIQW